MAAFQKLIDLYAPPEGYELESLIATTYAVDYEFFEDDFLALALGVRTPASRVRVFRAEIERRLQSVDVSVLFDLRGCPKQRGSPRIDALPVITRKQHAKISLVMWVKPGETGKDEHRRRVRLIIGSANLTRQGFRENYECATALDFEGSNPKGRALLTGAIDHVESLASECQTEQLAGQIREFRKFARGVADEPLPQDGPIAFVSADTALDELSRAWASLDGGSPDLATVVSPFWPEGVTAGKALAALVERLAKPKRLDLVCRGVQDGNGWVPEFDPHVAADLKERIASRLFLRSALASAGVEEEESDAGDETEADEIGRVARTEQADKQQPRRALHAKMIWLDGKKGSVGYIGSSNCTRRGLALGKKGTNWEAGFIYRLSRASRARFDPLAIAGEGIEVLGGKLPPSKAPLRDEDEPVPEFLADIVATREAVTIRFQTQIPVPDKFEILMPIPTLLGDGHYWLLYQRRGGKTPTRVSLDLRECVRCDTNLKPLARLLDDKPIEPAVYVEVRWDGNLGFFPVRFDDKASLPPVPTARRPTEDELIEYFLNGREPDWGGDGDRRDPGTGDDPDAAGAERSVDTSRILSYFIRNFVRAIPGIEAEIAGAAYSRRALIAALKGPTSPLELAERAFASLGLPPGQNEPTKTPMAVGFQLVEICAALERSRAQVVDKELRECFDPVIDRCRTLITELVRKNKELRDGAFESYRKRLLKDAA
jgi:hypothetical protein